MNLAYPATAHRLERIIAALKASPLNFHQLAIATSTSESALRKYIVAIHSGVEQCKRQIHIAGWQKHGTYGIQIAIYAAGQGRDKRKPRPLTIAEKNSRYFKRRKADDLRHALWLAKRRARGAADRARTTPNTWLSALGGI